MFEIKKLARSDFDFAVDLANTMNWQMAKADFEFALTLEPDGCFLIKEGSTRLGIATCVSYGKVGWFGNLIVDDSNRRKGAGTALVAYAVNYLLGRGVETIGLYAYRALAGFYAKLGFKEDCIFSLLHTAKLPKIQAMPLPAVRKKDFLQVTEFDARCFGGTRKRLLCSIIKDKNNLSAVLYENKLIVGYVAATVTDAGAWIGPLVCQTDKIDAAVSIVKSVLASLHGKSVYVVVSENDKELFEFFSRLGFTEEFSVSRMFLGKATAQDCVYIAESLERG